MNIQTILGVAQFGSDYGITNSKKLNFYSANRIIDYSKKYTHFLDTAIDYKKANIYLSKIDLSEFKINSKILIKHNDTKKSVVAKIKKHIKLLNVKKLNTLFIHNVSEFIINKKNKDILESIQDLKKKNVIKYLGVSIYDFREIRDFMKLFKPDIVQLPLNVFDRRFLEKKIVLLLKKNEIKIQVRSLFLQGLLNSEKFPKNFKKYEEKFLNWEKWCKKKKLTKTEGCIFFIKGLKFINEIVVGVASFEQIKVFFKIMSTNKKIKIPNYFQTKDRNIIDPRLW